MHAAVHIQGHFPFDEKFQFEFPDFSREEWNSIF